MSETPRRSTVVSQSKSLGRHADVWCEYELKPETGDLSRHDFIHFSAPTWLADRMNDQGHRSLAGYRDNVVVVDSGRRSFIYMEVLSRSKRIIPALCTTRGQNVPSTIIKSPSERFFWSDWPNKHNRYRKTHLGSLITLEKPFLYSEPYILINTTPLCLPGVLHFVCVDMLACVRW